MIEQKVTYEDYDGNNRTETAMFHLNKVEFTKWLAMEGDYSLDKVIEKIITTHNAKEMVNLLDGIISMSYGEKSLDGRQFLKSPESLRLFKQSEMYSELFNQLLTDDKRALEFIIGVMPKDVAKEIKQEMSKNPDALPERYRSMLQK